MVSNLVHDGFLVLALFVEDTAVGEGGEGDIELALVVDLVEGHPVLDLVLVPLEADGSKADEEVHQLAVPPAAVLGDQMVRHFEVGQGDDRLHAVFVHFVEEVIVELQACLVGLCFVSLGEDAGPGNGSAEALEAHFCQQGNVFFVAVVELDALMVGVVLAGEHALGDFAGHTVAACGHDISHADALAAFLPAAFQLMGSYGAAP